MRIVNLSLKPDDPHSNLQPPLDFLTPERDEVDFLEDDCLDSDFDSIWQLERGAKEGLTSGIDESPTETGPMKVASEVAKVDSPMSTSTEVSETTSTCSPVHNNGAIQKRIRMCQNVSETSSPSKSSLTLNIKPSWMSPKLQLLQCPLCDHHSQEPSKLEEHVNRVHFDPQSPRAETSNKHEAVAASSRGQKTPSTLPCPLCTAHYATSLELERHVNTDHRYLLLIEQA